MNRKGGGLKEISDRMGRRKERGSENGRGQTGWANSCVLCQQYDSIKMQDQDFSEECSALTHSPGCKDNSLDAVSG